MLKRLSFNSTPLDPPLLYPPSPAGGFQRQQSPNQKPTTSSSSSSFPFPLTIPQPTISSETLHNTKEKLTTLLIALDEYRTLCLHIAKCEMKIGKALSDLSYGFTAKGSGGEGGRSEVVVGALNASSSFFEVSGEVDNRYSKAVQKEYESLNEIVAKGFKKLAKEEKVFEEALESLNSKVLKATTSYEKSRPLPSSRSRPSSSDVQSLTDSHNRYISSLSTFSATITQLKKSHSESIGEKRQIIVKEVGRSLAGLSEMNWKNKIESVKKGGQKIGEVLEKGVFCENAVYAPEEENFPNFDSSSNRISDVTKDKAIKSPPIQTQLHPNYTQSFSSNTSNYDAQSLQPPSFPSQSRSSSRSVPSSPHQYIYADLPQDRPSSQTSQYNTDTRNFSPQRRPSGDSFGSRHTSRPLPDTSRLVPGPNSPPLPSSPRPLAKTFDQPPPPTQNFTFNRIYSSEQSQSTLRSYLSEESTASRPLPSPNEELRRIVAPRDYLPQENQTEVMSPSGIMDVWNSGLRLEQSDDISRPNSVYKPIARYDNNNGGEGGDQEDRDREDELKRKESTMSERSFVNRMKEKYAQEKENNREDQLVKDRRVAEEVKDKSSIPRSDSRVANLAARYSTPIPLSEPLSNATTTFSARQPPSRHRSQSVQPEIFSPKLHGLKSEDSSISLNYSNHSQLDSNDKSQNENPRSYSRQSLPTTPIFSDSQHPQPYKNSNTKIRFSDSALPSATSNSEDQASTAYLTGPHSSVCACGECTRLNYGSVKGGIMKGGERESQRQEEEIQRDLRKVGSSRPGMKDVRRLSMPIIFGSTSRR